MSNAILNLLAERVLSLEKRIEALEKPPEPVVAQMSGPVDPFWSLTPGDKRLIILALNENKPRSSMQSAAELNLSFKLEGKEYLIRALTDYYRKMGW